MFISIWVLLGPVLSAFLCFKPILCTNNIAYIWLCLAGSLLSIMLGSFGNNLFKIFNKTSMWVLLSLMILLITFYLDCSIIGFTILALILSLLALLNISESNFSSDTSVNLVIVFISVGLFKFLFHLLDIWLPFSLIVLLISLLVISLTLYYKQLLYASWLTLASFALAFFMNCGLLLDVNYLQYTDLIQVGFSDLHNFIIFSMQEPSTTSNPSSSNNSVPSSFSGTSAVPITASTEELYGYPTPNNSPTYPFFNQSSYEQATKEGGRTSITQERFEATTEVIDSTLASIQAGVDPIEAAGIQVVRETLGRMSRSVSPTLLSEKDQSSEDGTNFKAAGLFFFLVNNRKLFFHIKFNILSYLIYFFYAAFSIFLYLDLFNLYSGFQTYFYSRVPNIALITSNEHFLVLYNIIIIMFFSFVLIYFIISITYCILYYFAPGDGNNINYTFILFNPNLNSKLQLLLYNYLKLNLVLILFFSLLLYLYFNISIEFAVTATIVYKQLIEPTVQIVYYLGNYRIDYYVFYFLIFSKAFLGYIWTITVIKYSNLKFIEWSLIKPSTFKIINDKKFFIKFIIVMLLLRLIKYISDYVSYSLFIEPSNSSAYMYTLGEITEGNNYCHLYILVSTLIMIICFYLIKYTNHVLTDIKDGSDVLFINLTKRDLTLFIRGILLVIFSMSYHTLLVSTLWMFTHYIPGGYITINRII